MILNSEKVFHHFLGPPHHPHDLNVEEIKEIERVGGEGMEEVRDEPEDIKRIAPWTKQITVRGIVASIYTVLQS